MLQYAIISYGNRAPKTFSGQHFDTIYPSGKDARHPFNFHLLQNYHTRNE